ncbi:MAG: hypothetical protein CL868_05850 [Cytophagaceae bacterium]|nr:hypothetical protein [Cytophagaceae bacterium]
MLNQQKFDPQHAALTPAQYELIEFCRHVDIPDIVHALETTIKQAAFFNREDIQPEIAEKFLTTDYLLQALKRMEKEGPNPTLATV